MSENTDKRPSLTSSKEMTFPEKDDKEMASPLQTLTKDEKAFLDIKAEAAKLQQVYIEDPKQNSFNLLLLGESGSGKTSLCATARAPIHFDSFDPGGTKALMEDVKKGRIIVDSRWESEDPTKPTIPKASGAPGFEWAFTVWKAEFERRLKMGYFNHIGTYVLDSSTTWAMAVMNSILAKANIPGQAPRFTHDYTPQKIEMINMIKKMLDLPCDFILTGHLESDKDEVSGRIKYKYMTTGKAEVTIPLQFDEIWTCVAEQKGMKDIDYRVLTAKNGAYPGATRIGKGKFETFETPDIKYLLKKAGRDYSDKPLLR